MTRKILLDTNAYLRLGEILHPLLLSDIPGDSGGELWILPELYRELERNPRLRNQFSWALNPEMIENRKKCRWRLSSETKDEIEATYRFAVRLSQELGNGASPFDMRCLAYGYVLGVDVVTDDGDMAALAAEIGTSVISTIELLGLMVAAGTCVIDQARSAVRYWIAVDDLPPRYRTEYRRVFDEEPPDTAY